MQTKNENFKTNQNEVLKNARIKRTRTFIISHTFCSLLNNQKWYRFFEWLENNRSLFSLKTLLRDSYINDAKVIELEQIAVIVDNSTGFIEFLEIEVLKISHSPEITNFLNAINIPFKKEKGNLLIYGYSINHNSNTASS